MKSAKDPAKKIVSKGKYAQVQSQRGGIMLLGSLLFVMTGICVFFALCLLAVTIYCVCTRTWESVVSGYICGLLTALMGAAAFGFAKAYLAAIKKADEINNVVPLTRATAPYLSAQDSLVRASVEPSAAP